MKGSKAVVVCAAMLLFEEKDKIRDDAEKF
jgi:hypothetical protein